MTTCCDFTNGGLSRLPRRRDDLHVEELDGEAVLYDPRTGAVHRFNATTFMVWKACDGTQRPHDLALGLMEDFSVSASEALRVVRQAIEQLTEKELLVEEPCAPGTTDGGEALPFAVSEMEVGDGGGNAIQEALKAIPSAESAAEAGAHGVSRRELLGGGITTAIIAAPVISTFFAAGAYASGPSASGAYGIGGCKTIGYSCVVNGDCCESGTKTACQEGKCCVQHNESGCMGDETCCNANDVCIGGVCQ